MNVIEQLVGAVICGFVKGMTAAKVTWRSGAPKESGQRIYFANHRSHADAVLLWSALPSGIRRQTRPVAGADYWLTNAVKRYVAEKVFQCVLIDRERSENGPDPIEQMVEALDAGASLIIFPEGTRNLEEGVKPFKSGLYHLAKARPEVELVPVWLENMGRVMPKGAVIPVPLICTLNFGEAMHLTTDESKEGFLERTRQALLNLMPAREEGV
ncbi:MAG: lysophospholipid acyltransferase family protein [Saezia sp.]